MKNLLGLIAILFLFNSCEVEPDPTNAREDFLGHWSCNEYEGDFAPQSYDVEIIAIGTGNSVGIRGLYNQGTNFIVQGEISNNLIFLTTQTINGIQIGGNGELNNNFNRIDLSFTADDGSGPDYVKANLLR